MGGGAGGRPRAALPQRLGLLCQPSRQSTKRGGGYTGTYGHACTAVWCQSPTAQQGLGRWEPGQKGNPLRHGRSVNASRALTTSPYPQQQRCVGRFVPFPLPVPVK